MEMTIFTQKPGRALAGKAAFAVFSGVIGTLVLAAFCVVIMDIYHVVKYLPWIIAFNTAMTGFSLVEKSKNLIVRKYPAALAAGLANVVITLVTLIALSNYFAGENLLGVSNISLLLVIGVVCSGFGAWLAVKARS